MCVLELWSLLSLPRLWALPCCPCALRGSQPRAAVLLGDQSESSTPSVPSREGSDTTPGSAVTWLLGHHCSLLPALRNSREISCGAPLSGNVSGQILLLECSASSPHPAEVLAFEQCWLDGPMLEGSPWCVLAMTQAAHSQGRVALPHRVTPNTDFGLKPKMKH